VAAQRGVSKSLAIALASIPSAVTLALLWWLIASGKWSLFGISTMGSVINWKTGFGDLAFITGTSECFIQGQTDLDLCDPYGRPYSPYGFIPGQLLSWLNLGLEETGLLGSALAGIWILLVFWLTYRIARAWKRGLFELTVAVFSIALFAISPTLLLAVERGSLDILVTALSALGLAGFATTSKLKQGASVVALFFAVALKYFAVGLFAPFFAPRRWSLIGIVGAVVTTIFLMLNLQNLRLASEIAGTGGLSTSRLSFSNTTGIVTILVDDPLAFQAADDSGLSGFALRIVSLLLIGILVTALTIHLRKMDQSTSAQMPIGSWLFVVGGTFAILLPYLIGASYDYRLILLIIPLAGLLMWVSTTTDPKMVVTLWVMVTLTVVVALSNASMEPNDYGFYLPKWVVVTGDAALATVLAFGAALFISAWLPKRKAAK